MRVLIVLTAFLVVPFMIVGQESRDTSLCEKHLFLKQYGLPAGLLAGSLILQTGNIKQDIQDLFPNTTTHIDDWLKFGPTVEMYALDMMGVKHRSSVFAQTNYLLISQFFTGGIVQALKVTANVTRPSGGKHSFPSGHTSYAFVGATVMFREFIETKPLLAYSGFAFAAATGILRITKDAHWLPDVMAGAAIGILVTNMVYQIKPIKGWQPFNKKRSVFIVPQITDQGLSLTMRF